MSGGDFSRMDTLTGGAIGRLWASVRVVVSGVGPAWGEGTDTYYLSFVWGKISSCIASRQIRRVSSSPIDVIL